MKRLVLVLLACVAGCGDPSFLVLHDDEDDATADVDQVHDVVGDELQRESSPPETAGVDVAGDAADTAIEPAPETAGDAPADSGDSGSGDTTTADAGDVDTGTVDTPTDTGTAADVDAGDAKACRKESELCMGLGACCPGLTCSPIIGLGCVK